MINHESENRQITYNCGKLELVLAPHLGGSIARFDYVDGPHRQSLLRPAAPDAADVLGMASFPLVPYANRIRGGSFICNGETISLAPNLEGDASPLHGQGWLNPWQLVSSEELTARLGFVHQAGEWPWHYEAWQDFVLNENGLTVTLGCRNLSPASMPCGLAQHPYFPCDAGTTIDASVTSAWTADENTLPVDCVPAEGRFNLRDRAICGADLDHAFEGWNGRADITWLDGPVRLALSSPDATRFHVYSPVGQGYFAAEPVQNAICALNAPQDDWEASGITMLKQGESHQMTMRLQVTPAD